ncbi:MAG: hypothetical protein C0598_02575 [Marinilabiliales bacterium]|nr:MAG: hypothetical protein C0598_02575 [Marinilabiliales bacterium]
MRGRLLTLIILFFITVVRAQFINHGDTIFMSDTIFSEVDAMSWSPDSKSLVFSAKQMGSTQLDLFVYSLANERLKNLSQSFYDENNPIWHPDGNRIIYDKLVDSLHKMMVINPLTLEEKPLLNRDIQSRQGSFANDSILICFSGYDVIDDKWQIYTYDFVYDNLNQLTNNNYNCIKPLFSPNGKHIIYEEIDSMQSSQLKMINWYGKDEVIIDSISVSNPSWNPDSWRFNFISKTERGEEVFSLRYNGQSPLQLSFNDINEKLVSISPDSKHIAVVIEMEDYNYIVISDISN